VSRRKLTGDFSPDLLSDDDAIALVIDAVLSGSKRLRRVTKEILKAQS
jgi:hypothetical protein